MNYIPNIGGTIVRICLHKRTQHVTELINRRVRVAKDGTVKLTGRGPTFGIIVQRPSKEHANVLML